MKILFSPSEKKIVVELKRFLMKIALYFHSFLIKELK